MSRPQAQVDSIARNTAFAVAVRLTGTVFTAILTIFLVRYLGPAEYGVFALAMGVGALVTVPSDLGISMSAARFSALSVMSKPVGPITSTGTPRHAARRSMVPVFWGMSGS